MLIEPRTLQEHVEDEIVDILSDKQVRETAEINRSVRLRLPPTAADQELANKRANETKYDQIISNALRDVCRLCRTDLIRRSDKGEFQITEAGLRYAAARRRELDDAGKFLDQTFPGGFD